LQISAKSCVTLYPIPGASNRSPVFTGFSVILVQTFQMDGIIAEKRWCLCCFCPHIEYNFRVGDTTPDRRRVHTHAANSFFLSDFLKNCLRSNPLTHPTLRVPCCSQQTDMKLEHLIYDLFVCLLKNVIK